MRAAIASVTLALALAACTREEFPSSDASPASDTPDAAPSDARSDAAVCARDGGDGGDAGCVCAPATRRCDPDHAGVLEQCAPAGDGWVTAQTCGADEVCNAGACIAPCADPRNAGHSYLGCDFWAATLDNPWLDPLASFPFAVAIANPNPYFVTVHIDGGALAQPLSQSVRPGGIATITLPWVNDLVTPETASSLVTHAAYHVQANGPIIAYEFNPLTFESTGGRHSFTNDASLLLPTAALTAHYTQLGYPGGQLAIVGTSATPTEVTVHAADVIRPGQGVTASAAGATRTFTLAQGDVLQLGSRDLSGLDPMPTDDLSGTTVSASAPVAVFSAHPCTNVIPRSAWDEGTQFDLWTCDHLEDQLLPNETWGRRYAVSAFIDRPGLVSHVRVIALHDGTTLTFDPPQGPAVPTTLDAHRVIDFETAGDVVVSASGPVLVAQFMISAHGADPPANLGDPSLVFESPVEQHRADSIVLTPATYTHNYLAIVGPSDQPPELDGATLTTAGRPIGGSGLSVWALEVRPGTHRVRGTRPDAAYGVKVYGIAPYTSYAYPGGLDLDPIAPPG